MSRIICFGEVLLRLSAPTNELLLQSARLNVCVGGAEANVAVSLAKFGHDAATVSILPDNPLGRSARDELRRHGVDTSSLRFVEGRMGLYFLSPGAVVRPSEVTYDRAGSAFALASEDAIDWEKELDGADWFHVSGVTPAVGPSAANAVVKAVQTARKLGVPVSFDGNYRAKMWAAWNGDGPAVLRQILDCADLAFVNDRDIALILGESFLDESAQVRRRKAAERAFEVFPNLKRMTSTVRLTPSADHHELSAVILSRGGGEHITRAFPLAGVVDRIGGGDAFAAGVLHGLLTGMDDADAVEFGLAAGALKHAVFGDFNLVSAGDVHALLDGEGLDVKR